MSTTEARADAGRPGRPPLPLRGPDARPRRVRTLAERAVDRLPFAEKEMPVVAALVQPGWTCVDIGAAGGTYTHLLSRAVGPTGRVLAVEPRSRSMRYLRRFRTWLGWHNVVLHQVALSDASGVADLDVPRFVRTEAHLTTGRTRVPAAGARATRTEAVTTTTLDELVRSSGAASVDLVKCDVEGAELQVLRGAEDTLARHRPVVVCEIEARHLARYGQHPDDVLAWFVARGYRAHRVLGGGLVAVDRILADENDYVLLPSERLGS